MAKRRIGLVFVVIGAVLMVSALLLFFYNTIEAKKAGESSSQALSAIRDVMEQPALSTQVDLSESTSATEDPEDVSYLTEPEVLERVEIDGYHYIGYLSIPALELELPVMSEISEDRLYKSPCLEKGSPITDDCVIAGHNYKYHFLPLHDILEGEIVTFTYMNGYVVRYEVVRRTIVEPTDIPAVHDSVNDLVMYTCTSGGASRVVVYCDRVADFDDAVVS